MPRRYCKEVNRNGDPCMAHPLEGTDLCMAHSPESVRESVGFVANNGFQGRPALPKPTDVARRLVEENVVALLRPYWRTLGYDVQIADGRIALVELEDGGAKIYGTSAKDGRVFVSEHDDLGAMMQAAEKLLDRVYGKPKQVSEVSGPDGAPIAIDGTVSPGPAYLGEAAQEAARMLLERAGGERAKELGAGDE